ncbi:MAG: acetate--CoA ligase family protein [Candidatus Moranbacteria bacterium]|nr:acetate--CoA ligase family protein [Candidatus Moranbacteria bacterium]
MHLEALFSPRSIAVIGASTKQGSVGFTLTENLLQNGFSGKIYPVNPKTATLFELPCFPNIAAIEEEIDLAIIIVPAAIVPVVLREVGEKKVPAAIIISAGFKETGAEGKALEDEVITLAKKYHIALLGPNCLGFLHPKKGLNASFAKQMPKDGSIAFFSQSGALCTALLDLTKESLGFSHFISIGNKALLDENTLLRFLAQEKEVETIAFYTEGLSSGEQLIETGRSILARAEAKPIIALKSGTTEAGSQASSSHTGALAGSERAYQGLFQQARILRADSLEKLLDFLNIFSHNPLAQGNRLAIITNAGGLGVLATDTAIKNNLELATLSPETTERLTALLPPAGSVRNPIDVLGDALADRYRMSIDLVAQDERVDMLLVIVTPQTMTEAQKTAEAIIDVKKRSGKPVAAVFAGHDSLFDGIDLLKKNNVSVFSYPEAAVSALAGLHTINTWRKEIEATPFSFSERDQQKTRLLFETVRKEQRTMFKETEALSVLHHYGFPLLRTMVVQNATEAKQTIDSFNCPVALKIISPDIIHKSDAHGVLLDIEPKNIESAYETLLKNVSEKVPLARIEGALVVEMAKKGGQEILLGLKKEPGLGTAVLVGLGGIFTEIFQDVSLRFAPLTKEDAREMLTELKGYPLLSGARGQKSINIDKLVDMIGRLSQLAMDFPDIAELDINPLLVFPDEEDFLVLDARIHLEK